MKELVINAPIVNGPSKFDFMLSLFKKGEQVEFSLSNSEGRMCSFFQVRIDAIEAEDGSRESWNIRGYIVGQSLESLLKDTLKKSLTVLHNSRPFHGYYNSRTRSGHMSWTKP